MNFKRRSQEKVVRLTEGQLHNIIAESVNQILAEEEGYGILNPSAGEEAAALQDAMNTIDELIDVFGGQTQTDRRGNIIIGKIEASNYRKKLLLLVMPFLNGVKNRI